jgi:lipopolysaccharide export system protein LptA
MRISVERLRVGLLAGAVLLVLVIAGFLAYARYRVRRTLVNLPARMGATITKEFNGYTYSQSDGKRTVFTLHAAKAVQHTDNTLTLHDVQMVLYGKKGDRADRISGDQFEYDTKNEVVRAAGIVHIDLEAPPAEKGGSGSEGRVIHVTTSGLVYMKQLAIAATDQGIDFTFGGFTGHAIGAEYSSDTGHLILQSAVTMSGLDRNQKNGGRPVAMAATHGELDRANELAEFENARYSSAGQAARADQARIHMRGDGSVDRIEGERNVSLSDSADGSATSDRADVKLDAKSKPVNAVLTGSVKFEDDEPLRQVRGDSDSANLEFDGQGRIDHALLTGRVHTTERVKGTGSAAAEWPQRDLAAERLDLVLIAEGAAGKAKLREATASGAAGSLARMVSVAPAAKGGGVDRATLAGDTLVAHFVDRNGVDELSTVHGAGHTVVEQTTALGVNQRSAGELLDAAFRERGKTKGAVELASAVQRGGVSGPVVIDRSVPAKRGSAAGTGPDLQHATAGMAAFDADTGRLILTENVAMSDAGSTLTAARVVMEQGSGDAEAEGGVKVSYLQPTGTGEPVHVLAARAELKHDDGVAFFYGAAGAGTAGLARMWQTGAGGQGGSQIEAPVLVFEQEARRLTARAETPGAAGMVHTTLMDAKAAGGPAAGRATSGSLAKAAGKPQRQGVARITSSMMVYSDALRQAVFTGGVRVLDGEGEMRSREATVFLSAAKEAGAGKTVKAGDPSTSLTGLTGGHVERIVATGQVEMAEPGRRATGDRLVYTAADEMYLLTGTAAAPPKVVDEAQGTTTGAELRFHSGDDNVVVSGGNGTAVAQRVRTETRVKQK